MEWAKTIKINYNAYIIKYKYANTHEIVKIWYKIQKTTFVSSFFIVLPLDGCKLVEDQKWPGYV